MVRDEEKRTLVRHAPREVLDLGLGRVLPERAEQVAQLRLWDARRAALVEQGEGLADLGGGWGGRCEAGGERGEEEGRVGKEGRGDGEGEAKWAREEGVRELLGSIKGREAERTSGQLAAASTQEPAWGGD